MVTGAGELGKFYFRLSPAPFRLLLLLDGTIDVYIDVLISAIIYPVYTMPTLNNFKTIYISVYVYP